MAKKEKLQDKESKTLKGKEEQERKKEESVLFDFSDEPLKDCFCKI